MNSAEVEIFKMFEATIDMQIRDLKIKSMPARVPYTHLICLLEAAHAKGNLSDSIVHPNLGPSILSRLSYLLPVFSACPLEPGGENAFDAVQAMGDDLRDEMKLLLNYAHFCEVAPFAWRGAYNIKEAGEAIALTHRSDEIQRFEAKDIILSRLPLSFTIDAPETYNPYYNMWAASGQEPQISDFEEIVSGLFSWFLRYSFEISPLSDTAIERALGVGDDQFRRFRAVWHAFAAFHLGMSNAIRQRLHEHPEEDKKIGTNFFDWVAPLIKEDYIEALITRCAKLNSVQYAALMSIYSFDPHVPIGGEGFFPPVCRLKESLLISPWALRGMLSARNILYTLQKTDRKKFDDEVSPLLEPRLTEIASKIFRHLQDVQIIPNFIWSKGEFDLLVHRKSENCVLHVQIKAAIAPEGARMTTRVESRIREGLEQLANFKKLKQPDQDLILSTALSQKITSAKVVDIILCWSGFGTSKIWSLLGDVAPLNIALLAHLVRADTRRSLSTFAQDTHSLIDQITTEANPVWNIDTIELGPKKISFPNLDCDWDSLVKYQTAAYKFFNA